MEVRYNPNYLFLHRNWADADVIALQGSSRSGKTYSIYDFIISLFLQYPNAKIELDAVRDSLPVLKATILKEFVERLEEYGLYHPERHNMTDKRIEINGNYFNYYSVDTEMKARGRKRHILWLNEPNNIPRSVIDQLLIRTTHKVITDFNPSEPIGMEHWLYDDILQRARTKTIITTYKDNPFLSPFQIAEIEKYKETDPDFFKVFGLGERGSGRKGQIFTHFKKCQELPKGRYFYGLDFGKTNNATALSKCVYYEDALYVEELIYQTGLTASDIGRLMKQHQVNDVIRADSAEPLMIAELQSMGFDVRPSVKGKGSVTGGIDKLKGMDVFITSGSKNFWREAQWYTWKLDINGNPTNEPIDMHNDGIDSIRYAVEDLITGAKPLHFSFISGR